MKEKKIPMRKCIGCNASKPKKELLRIAYYEGVISVDITGKAKGRGVYLCRDDGTCIDKALKRKAFERNFKGIKEEQVLEIKERLKDENNER